jgi:hypothetical protein
MASKMSFRLGLAGVALLGAIATAAPAFADDAHEWSTDAPAGIELPVRAGPAATAADAVVITHEFEGVSVYQAGVRCTVSGNAMEMDAVTGGRCVRSLGTGVTETAAPAEFEHESPATLAIPPAGVTPFAILGGSLVDR